MNRAKRPIPPSRMYRGMPWRQVPFVSLDFETTGLDLRRDAVVSFGAVPVRGGRIPMADTRYRVIAPAVPPSRDSIVVHHLRPQDVAGAPPLEDVVDELRGCLDRRYLLAWRADVEAGFLSRIFRASRRGWLRHTIDVWRLEGAVANLERLDRPDGREGPSGVDGSSTDGRGLMATARRYGIPPEEAHHALDDAVMTAELFLALAARLEARGVSTLRGFLRATWSQYYRLP